MTIERLSVVDEIELTITKVDRITREGRVAYVYSRLGFQGRYGLPWLRSLDPELVVLLETRGSLEGDQQGYVNEKIQEYITRVDDVVIPLENIQAMTICWFPVGVKVASVWTGMEEIIITPTQITWRIL